MKNKLLKRILALISIAFFLISVGLTSVQPHQDKRGNRGEVELPPLSASGMLKGHLPPPGESNIRVTGRQAEHRFNALP
ncbi:hypothetical protein [Niastella populi]|uniref:Uncharacterized protein n=1 Tax=Niastella populi TaxID=550983 RepID=A0A1V9G9Z9_9BACT|nr:hypothetical protein [Niastella populi]OQP67491.1 hypothetical protein A4R26_33380 [Niastella populi]